MALIPFIFYHTYFTYSEVHRSFYFPSYLFHLLRSTSIHTSFRRPFLRFLFIKLEQREVPVELRFASVVYRLMRFFPGCCLAGLQLLRKLSDNCVPDFRVLFLHGLQHEHVAAGQAVRCKPAAEHDAFADSWCSSVVHNVRHLVS